MKAAFIIIKILGATYSG